MSLRSELIDGDSAFSELEMPWRALARRSKGTTVFSTFEWQAAWWRHYGSGCRPRFAAAWQGSDLVGLVPAYVRRGGATTGRLPVREMRLVGTGGDTSPDYMGALLDPTHVADAATLLANAILDGPLDWDVLRFTDMAVGDFPEALESAVARRGCSANASLGNRIRVVRLPSTWDEYLAGMHRDRRYRVRKLRRIATEELGATFDVCRGGDGLHSRVGSLVELHRKRWEQKASGEGSFRSSAYLGFHRDVIDECARNGWIRIYAIDVAGRPAAIYYCYRYRNDVLYFQSGFDPAYERYSLGQVLMGWAIQSAIEEGATTFDLLQGDHPYKASWANDETATRQVVAYRKTVPGVVTLAADRLRTIVSRHANAHSPSD